MRYGLYGREPMTQKEVAKKTSYFKKRSFIVADSSKKHRCSPSKDPFFRILSMPVCEKKKRFLKLRDVSVTPDETYVNVPCGTMPLKHRPVVVGFGPSGMFAALLLARQGYKPIVLERGSQIDRRQKSRTGIFGMAMILIRSAMYSLVKEAPEPLVTEN